MDFFKESVTGLLSGNKAAFNTSMKPLTPQQTKHMKHIFATLAGGILMTAVGSWVASYVIALPPIVCTIAQLALVMYIQRTPPHKNEMRFAAFGVTTFLMGMSLAPLLAMANIIKPTLVTNALVLTGGFFVCCFLSASYSTKRAYLYIGPIVSVAAGYLAWTCIISMFWPTKFGDTVILYGGLLVSMGYMYYFSQKTLVDCERGNRDFLLHALQFYTELVSIFVRVVIILMEKEQKKEQKERREEEKRR